MAVNAESPEPPKPNYVFVFIGVLFILVATAIAVFVCPLTDPILLILRTLMAIGSTLILTFVKTSIEFKYNFIKATGAVVLGVLIYLINPPGLINENNEGCRNDPPNELRGTVFLNERTVSGVNVLLIGSNQLPQLTDIGGNFTFHVKRKDLEQTTSIQFDFSDTSLVRTYTTDSILDHKFEVRFKIAKDVTTKILDGYVWDSNGNGLDRVRVLVKQDTTYTDDGGHFRMELKSAENTVHVNFSKKGYKSITMPLTLPNNDVSITLNK